MEMGVALPRQIWVSSLAVVAMSMTSTMTSTELELHAVASVRVYVVVVMGSAMGSAMLGLLNPMGGDQLNVPFPLP